MACSSNTVGGNTRVSQERHSNRSLQQHDSATTLDLPINMECSKTESLGSDAKKMVDQQKLREFGIPAKRGGSVTSGLLSGDKSPDRGSITSYRVSSRPGTAQTYNAAEVKKHYAGELVHVYLLTG